MRKGMRVSALLLVAVLVFAGVVWGERDSPPGSFSGTITRIDRGSKEIVVHGNKAEKAFRWSPDTAVRGPGGERLALKDLRAGMIVIVLYGEGDQNRMAARIDVMAADPEVSKMIKYPFACGIRVC